MATYAGGDTTEAVTMELHRPALRLLAGGIGLLAIMAATAAPARAQPDPSPPWVPSIIDQLVTSTPALSVDPGDESDQSTPWGGVGMFCENLFVRCR